VQRHCTVEVQQREPKYYHGVVRAVASLTALRLPYGGDLTFIDLLGARVATSEELLHYNLAP
jgi:hypothetical protein